MVFIIISVLEFHEILLRGFNNRDAVGFFSIKILIEVIVPGQNNTFIFNLFTNNTVTYSHVALILTYFNV